jgi:hypothetical protein
MVKVRTGLWWHRKQKEFVQPILIYPLEEIVKQGKSQVKLSIPLNSVFWSALHG